MESQLQNSRYGFYYFPDTTHYRESDLRTWLPELQGMGASWITLLAPSERAIPESFIRPLIEAGIRPIIHLPLPIDAVEYSRELGVFFEAYAHWGVEYIVLFDRPNQMKNWNPSSWARKNLVERFTDQFIPLAHSAMEAGLTPVFPPLEPGGDYWDTAFLHAALQAVLHQGHEDLLDRLVLSAYAWPGNRSPDWGAGGPERWPSTRPYSTPANSQDHLGFRIFDWYLAICEAALDKLLPVILLGGGSRMGDQLDPSSPPVNAETHAIQNLSLVRIMQGQAPEYEPVPPEVLTCNFWLLATAQADPQAKNAWFKPDLEQLPVVTLLKEWAENEDTTPADAPLVKSVPALPFNNPRPIAHYLLLPTFEWGPADWHLDAIRPFINKYQPTIGFSPVEAAHAKRVTVVGGASAVPESIIDGLLAAGCVVEQISGDGMNIASTLASRSENSTLQGDRQIR